MRSTARNAGLALLMLGWYACANPAQPGEPDPPDDMVAVQAVRVTPQVVQFLAIGETRQLLATVFPTNATDQTVAWESSDPSVASVNAVGLVTAKSAGVGVFVTASTRDGGHQASVNVGVALNQGLRP